MNIKCWGARGSVPVCGEAYSVIGGDTTCLEVRCEDEDTVIIVDAGTGLRGLGVALESQHCRNVHLLMTHMHMDHVIGFPHFKLPG